MAVLKRYNSTTSAWEAVLIGEPGPPGSGSALGPLDFELITGTWDSGENASMVFIDDPAILNEKIVIVDAAATHEADPVIVQIDYGLGDLGDRFEVVSGSGSSLTIGYYIDTVPDPMEATNVFGPIGYLPTVPPYCVVTLTKALHADEQVISEETVMVDAWLMSAGQMELDV
jgi:hypothetical protein